MSLLLPKDPMARVLFKKTEAYKALVREERKVMKAFRRKNSKKKAAIDVKRIEEFEKIVASYEGEVKELRYHAGTFVFDDGRIYNLNSGAFCKLSCNRSGKLMKGFGVDGVTVTYAVDKLVYETFKGAVSEKHRVIHLDGNLQNNSIGNLALELMKQHRVLKAAKRKKQKLDKKGRRIRSKEERAARVKAYMEQNSKSEEGNC